MPVKGLSDYGSGYTAQLALLFSRFAGIFIFGMAQKGDGDESVAQRDLPDEVVAGLPWEVDCT